MTATLNENISHTLEQNLDRSARNHKEFLNDASESIVKDAVFFESRDQFDDYMRAMENQYYDKAQLPKTPYEKVGRENGPPVSLPEWPPKPMPT